MSGAPFFFSVRLSYPAAIMTEETQRLEALILHSQTSEIVSQKAIPRGLCPTATSFNTTHWCCLVTFTLATVAAVCDISRIACPRAHPELCIFLT